MRGHDEDDGNLDRQAADWLVQLGDAEEDDECHERFRAWLRQSPRHEHAFAEIAEWWSRLDAIDPQCRIDVRALLAESQPTTEPRPHRQSQPCSQRESRIGQWAHRHLTRVSRLAFGCIGTAIVLGGILSVSQLRADSIEYRTTTGERRIVRLLDGTVVHLNANTRIEVHADRNERTVELLAGEVLLQIEHDSTRPFKLVADNVTIRDIGTRFNVRRGPEDLEVIVVEGSVRVAHTADLGADQHRWLSAGTAVRAGQAATISYERGRLAVVQTLGAEELESRLAWEDNLLALKGRTLRDVVAEFNSRGTRTILIEDQTIADLRIGGRVASTDLETFVRSLEAVGVGTAEPNLPDDSNKPIRLVPLK